MTWERRGETEEDHDDRLSDNRGPDQDRNLGTYRSQEELLLEPICFVRLALRPHAATTADLQSQTESDVYHFQ